MYKLVLTGGKCFLFFCVFVGRCVTECVHFLFLVGPCGGKTTGQARLCTFFENLGWKVSFRFLFDGVLLQKVRGGFREYFWMLVLGCRFSGYQRLPLSFLGRSRFLFFFYKYPVTCRVE